MPEYTFALDDFPFQLDDISDCDVAVFSLNLTIIGTRRSRLAAKYFQRVKANVVEM